MALNIEDNEALNEQKPDLSNSGFNTNNNTHTSAPTSNVSSLTFGMGFSGLMSATQGSDYTNGIAKLLVQIYEGSNKKVKPKVHVFDKETFINLAYSSIVVTLLSDNIVNYFIILLEETGRKPLAAAEIISEWEASIKMPGSTPLLYTADDAINEILHNEIVNALKQEYGNVEFQTVDGIVLHKGHPELQMIGPMLATIAYNACYVESQLEGGGAKDLNIELATQQNKNKQLRYESNMSKAITVNEVGSPVRTDWRLDLSMVNNNNAANLMLNAQNAKSIINRVGGYVDALPEQVALPQVPGMPIQTGLRFRPNIIVTSNASESPTTGYMLLGIASAMVMTNKNMWLAALRPLDKKVNVGNLNILSKIDEEGQRIDFTSKNYNAQQVFAGISQMFSLEPIVSVDVEAFGPQSFYTSVLSAAAHPTATDEKVAAAQHIINTAHNLTNGRFPLDFPTNEIFSISGVVVPLGVWHDKTGERDIREIDLTFITSHSDDMNMINKWILSNLPMSATGLDPYISKVDVISKLIPTAEITGKAVRVTFTTKFITALMSAITSAGLNVRYEPEVKFTEDTNLSIMSSYLSNAGINTQAGFAKEIMQTSPNYQTAYTNSDRKSVV